MSSCSEQFMWRSCGGHAACTLRRSVVCLFLHFDPRVLLPLHASVLEPDLDLSLVQTQRLGDLDASAAAEVAAEVELFLQLQRLGAAVTRPRPLTFRFWSGIKIS